MQDLVLVERDESARDLDADGDDLGGPDAPALTEPRLERRALDLLGDDANEGLAFELAASTRPTTA